MAVASKVFDIEFPVGYFMSWYVTTQGGDKITVKLYDDERIYFERSRQDINLLPPLDYNGEIVKGKKLKLTVISNGSSQPKEMLASINSYNVTTPSGSEVGKGINICIEDWSDGDYNDACISLMAWKK